MKISNLEIDQILGIMNSADSFRNNISIKIPSKLRFAVRVNEKKMNEVNSVYKNEQINIIQNHIDQGHGTINEESKAIFDEEYIPTINEELLELANTMVDVDFQKVDSETINSFLEKVDISVPEEKIILLFSE